MPVKEGMKKVMVYLPEDIYEGLRLKAFEERTTMSGELVAAWVKTNRAWVKKAAKRGAR